MVAKDSVGIQRYKGLGEMNPAAIVGLPTMDPSGSYYQTSEYYLPAEADQFIQRVDGR